MLVLTAGSASELFAAACAAVLAQGAPVAPRGMATVELLGAHLCLTQPRRRLVDLAPVRVLNAAFAAAEAVWILSGSDAPWIYTYNRRLVDYADHGRLHGAYGPRLRCWSSGADGPVDQLDHVRRLLAQDPDSRQAVVQLFDPGRDFAGHKDVPCTLGYRFYVRDGRLQMHTTMRSQDLWLGFCYDVFTATMLQELLAGWLGVELGEYHHHVDSLHLYQHDLPSAVRLPTAVAPGPPLAPLAVAWEDFDRLLARVLRAELPLPVGWAELAQVLSSYRAWKAGDRRHAQTVAAGAVGMLGRALERWYDHLEGRHIAAVAAAEAGP